MKREQLESVLDRLFTDRFSKPAFLEQCVENLRQRSAQDDSAVRIQKLRTEINALCAKRKRVIDTFVEGVIGREERDQRLNTFDHDIQVTQAILMREAPATSMDTAKLIEAFVPLAEWEFWTREQKRMVLATLVPDIRVANYTVESLGLNASLFVNENTPMDRDSWQPPA
jgi:hypothetical protein